MGRPRKYATDAERQAAYRARYCEVIGRVSCDTEDTLNKIANLHDVPRTEVINSVLMFGLLNYPWLSGVPLFGKRLPRLSGSPTQARALPVRNRNETTDESED